MLRAEFGLRLKSAVLVGTPSVGTRPPSVGTTSVGLGSVADAAASTTQVQGQINVYPDPYAHSAMATRTLLAMDNTADPLERGRRPRGGRREGHADESLLPRGDGREASQAESL